VSTFSLMVRAEPEKNKRSLVINLIYLKRLADVFKGPYGPVSGRIMKILYRSTRKIVYIFINDLYDFCLPKVYQNCTIFHCKAFLARADISIPATLLRSTPKTVKNSTQNGFSLASSFVSPCHRLLKASARSFISFHERGMCQIL